MSHERVDGSCETAKWSLMNSLLYLSIDLETSVQIRQRVLRRRDSLGRECQALKIYDKCHEAHIPPLSKVYRTRPERSVERIAKDVEGLGYVKK